MVYVKGRRGPNLPLGEANAAVTASAQEALPLFKAESLTCTVLIFSTPVGFVPKTVMDQMTDFDVDDANALLEIMKKALATSSSISKNRAESAKRFE
jgi:hypothetical protein